MEKNRMSSLRVSIGADMNIGDKVKWMTMFNQLFAGTIMDICYDTATVRRVDGGICTVALSRLSTANCDDILIACDNLGGRK